TNIPEHLELNINNLQLNETLTAANLVLPEGATLAVDPETILATCAEVVELDDEDLEASGPAEPEIIGKKPDEESDDDK
ncbi:MAG: hypothetical protein N2C14_14530, partial [Planctomycetales bacterium]